MERFFGMMPNNEIEIEKRFLNSATSIHATTIQAGPNGWSILWSDGGCSYKDEVIGTEANYKNAYKELTEYYPLAIEIENKEIVSER